MAQEMNWAQQDGDRQVMAAPKCVEAVAKRTQQQARKTVARAAAKREDRVLRLQPALDQKDALPRLAGILLALPKETQACRQASRLGFKLVQDPVEFVSWVARQAMSSRKGHVVLASAAGDSDYAVCARIAAVIMGRGTHMPTASSGRFRFKLFPYNQLRGVFCLFVQTVQVASWRPSESLRNFAIQNIAMSNVDTVFGGELRGALIPMTLNGFKKRWSSLCKEYSVARCICVWIPVTLSKIRKR